MKLRWRCRGIGRALLAALLINSIGIASDGPLSHDIAHTTDHEVADTQTHEGGEKREATKTESIEITVGSEIDDDALNAIIDDIISGSNELFEAATEEERKRGASDTGTEEVQESELVEVVVKEGTQEGSVDTVDYAVKPEEKKPDAIAPLYVRELIGIEAGRNDSNPAWSPTGQMIAFERSKGDKKEILIARLDGTIVEKVYFRLPEEDNEMNFFFPGICEDVSYNAGVSWSPVGDRFVFMSNGGGGNYDLYLRELGNNTTTRLTEHEEKDGQARWSPVADQLLFVSGRRGKADIYLMNLADNATTLMTNGNKSYLYPQWSPDGAKIVMIYGSNENHDIYLIDDVRRPTETCEALTTWTYDDLRPIWSPDGKKIAFYSNYNSENDPKVWCIMVIAADGSSPTEGDGLVANVVATDVIPNIERGPAWMPDSSRIVYIKNDRQAYNPIYLVDIDERIDLPLRTETKMNYDVVCSADGTIAFRSQVEQWDHIYIAKLRQ